MLTLSALNHLKVLKIILFFCTHPTKKLANEICSKEQVNLESGYRKLKDFMYIATI